MNTRKLDLNTYADTASLKTLILKELLLFDPKKDSVAEFDDRLKSYIDRNKNLEIVFQVNRAEIERGMRFRLSSELNAQPFPENYEMGNPHNRWIWPQSDPKTDEEIQREKGQLEAAIQANLAALRDFLNELRVLGGGRILIEDR